jgi:hypothetical protein
MNQAEFLEDWQEHEEPHPRHSDGHDPDDGWPEPDLSDLSLVSSLPEALGRPSLPAPPPVQEPAAAAPASAMVMPPRQGPIEPAPAHSAFLGAVDSIPTTPTGSFAMPGAPRVSLTDLAPPTRAPGTPATSRRPSPTPEGAATAGEPSGGYVPSGVYAGVGSNPLMQADSIPLTPTGSFAMPSLPKVSLTNLGGSPRPSSRAATPPRASIGLAAPALTPASPATAPQGTTGAATTPQATASPAFAPQAAAAAPAFAPHAMAPLPPSVSPQAMAPSPDAAPRSGMMPDPAAAGSSFGPPPGKSPGPEAFSAVAVPSPAGPPPTVHLPDAAAGAPAAPAAPAVPGREGSPPGPMDYAPQAHSAFLMPPPGASHLPPMFAPPPADLETGTATGHAPGASSVPADAATDATHRSLAPGQGPGGADRGSASKPSPAGQGAAAMQRPAELSVSDLQRLAREAAARGRASARREAESRAHDASRDGGLAAGQASSRRGPELRRYLVGAAGVAVALLALMLIYHQRVRTWVAGAPEQPVVAEQAVEPESPAEAAPSAGAPQETARPGASGAPVLPAVDPSRGGS